MELQERSGEKGKKVRRRGGCCGPQSQESWQTERKQKLLGGPPARVPPC